MILLKTAYVLQTTVISLGLILNSFLLYVIFRFTKRSVGFYKWLMAGFSVYEMLYGFAVLLVMPLHFVAQRTWVAFSYLGPLSNVPVAGDFLSFYCVLYAAWLGFVLVNFLYRYISLCQLGWMKIIRNHVWIQVLFVLCFFTFIGGCSFCAYYSCRVNHISPKFINTLHDEYGIDISNNLSYLTAQVQDSETGEIMSGGVISMVLHVVFLVMWLSVIGFCCLKLWARIHQLQLESTLLDFKIEKQLFTVLILQTIIPLVFCGIPSLLHFTFPFWPKDAFFSGFSPLFAFCSSIPKALDPLVSLCCIQNYRDAVCLGAPSSTSVVTMETDSQSHNAIHPIRN